MGGKRVAFLSDVHGNSPALEAVLSDILLYEVDELISLGDIINGVDPQGCVALLRNWAANNNVSLTCIRGNAEAYLLTPDRDELLVYDDEWNIPVLNLVQWYEDRLTEEDMQWIGSFPDTLLWRDALLVHDSPLDRLAVHTEVDPHIHPKHHEWFYHGPGIAHDMAQQGWDHLYQYMEIEGISRIFCGHTHQAFIHERAERAICNVGSVGLPLDGDCRPVWVMLDTSLEGSSNLLIRRVEYDLSRIYQLFDETSDYPSFQERPGMMEAFKKWVATGIHWRFHMPGMLPENAENS
ncbi:MAG: metallophosphoesterase [Anaerolineae bacterium]|jgi:predicted phosphodiesterase|nr:metallophosphoesterase [Anaerolineae bacterium]